MNKKETSSATPATSALRSDPNRLFRARALEQLNISAEIDSQLPLVPRRTWLVVVGIAMLAFAGIMWAALTPSQTSVTAIGRAVATSGITQISTMAAGTLGSMLPVSGQPVTAGQAVFEVRTMEGTVPASSITAGTVWQVFPEPGAGVSAGEILGTVLPEGSDRTVLLAVDENQKNGLALSQEVVIDGELNGTVTMITPPLPVAQVESRTGLTLNNDGFYYIVTVSLNQPITAGTEVNGRIILSSESVLQRILGIN
jgi:biotin carboxyl carrier protein